MKRVLQEDGLVVLNNVALFVYFYSRACVVYCSRLSDEKSANKGGRIGGGSRPRRFILKNFCLRGYKPYLKGRSFVKHSQYQCKLWPHLIERQATSMHKTLPRYLALLTVRDELQIRNISL